MDTKYPDIEVQLSGMDVSAFGLMGAVAKAMRRADVPKTERDAFMTEAKAGDYNHLLRTCMTWVSVS